MFHAQGARWDTNINSLADSRLKELYPLMPVMFIKAVTQVRKHHRELYVLTYSLVPGQAGAEEPVRVPGVQDKGER